MKESVSILKGFGLTEYQSKALATLLERADITAKEISRKGEIPETKVYSVLDSLEDLNFISKSLERPKKFRATDPEFILSNLVDRQQKVVNELSERKKDSLKHLKEIYEEGVQTQSKRNDFYIQGMMATWKEVARIAERSEEYMYLMGDATAFKRGYTQSEPIQSMLDLVDRGGELRFIFPKDFDLKYATNIPSKVRKNLLRYYIKPNFKLRVSRDLFNITLIVADDKEIATGLHNGREVYGGFFSKDERMAKHFKDYYLNIWENSKDSNKLILDMMKNKVGKILY